MIIKCKMCGGDLEFQPGATYGTCEYCGSTSTIPQADDEGKLNRYNRANHFRRQCEFDKAVTAYEKLLEQDDTDAEAHWGAVISRYGIEYVEDPATKKRIPTCHRVQVASILADADYLAAVEHAPDAASRDLYKQQATEIAEIQKGILAISANEKPYDVFICYKETDEQGQRTRDSQWAQDVYYGLAEQGYKVFFSRITLEDKLGQQYEPYIFAALNSAKVMVVIGSKPEYFNAVWVKNEWSRYLALMAKDRKRLLIPCYRGMDPYDLPEELSSLQSQDMNKIGFMQDLLRGIKKVLDTDKRIDQSRTGVNVSETSATPGVQSLLKRAYIFLEDGEWNRADELCEQVLNLNPENAQAYLGKLLAELHVSHKEELINCQKPFDGNILYARFVKYADATSRNEVMHYITLINERNEIARKGKIYITALNTMRNAQDDSDYMKAANLFQSISGWKDSDTKCAEAKRLAAEARKQKAYLKAKTLFAKGDSSSIYSAIEQLKQAGDWKDAQTLIGQYITVFDNAKKQEEEEERKRQRIALLREQYDAKYQPILAQKPVKEKELESAQKALAACEANTNGSFKSQMIGFGVFILSAGLFCGFSMGFMWFMCIPLSLTIIGPILLWVGISTSLQDNKTKKELNQRCLLLKEELRKIEQVPSFAEFVASSNQE